MKLELDSTVVIYSDSCCGRIRMASRERKPSKEKVNQVKANWTPDNHELFIDLCLEQISLGNRPTTFLTREGWNNILEAFHSMTGLNYEKTQLKNHWDITKKHWTIWQKLITTETMKWDPNTRTFGASGQEWDQYLKVSLFASII